MENHNGLLTIGITTLLVIELMDIGNLKGDRGEERVLILDSQTVVDREMDWDLEVARLVRLDGRVKNTAIFNGGSDDRHCRRPALRREEQE